MFTCDLCYHKTFPAFFNHHVTGGLVLKASCISSLRVWGVGRVPTPADFMSSHRRNLILPQSTQQLRSRRRRQLAVSTVRKPSEKKEAAEAAPAKQAEEENSRILLGEDDGENYSVRKTATVVNRAALRRPFILNFSDTHASLTSRSWSQKLCRCVTITAGMAGVGRTGG